MSEITRREFLTVTSSAVALAALASETCAADLFPEVKTMS